MKKNKMSIYSGFSGVFGYFLGTILYELFFSNQFGDDLIIKGLVTVLTAAVVGILIYFYLKKKYPEETEELATLEKDVRGQLIRGKTSTFTLMFIAVLAVIIFIYAYVNNQVILSYMIAGGYVLTVFFNIGINSFLDKRI